MSPIGNILNLVLSLLVLVKYLIIGRCLLSFFPAVNWYQQPFRLIASIVDPIMAPFRGLIPPLGGLDLSPIILFFLLDILEGLLKHNIHAF